VKAVNAGFWKVDMKGKIYLRLRLRANKHYVHYLWQGLPIRVTWSQFFVHFFRGKFRGKFRRGKFSPNKCWEKSDFSTEKVLKNNFPKKFHRIFRGKSLSAEKNVQKIGRRDSISRTEISKTIPLDHAPKAQFF
jgi:hypothetical protein